VSPSASVEDRETPTIDDRWAAAGITAQTISATAANAIRFADPRAIRFADPDAIRFADPIPIL
jgi:hypothetical protein